MTTKIAFVKDSEHDEIVAVFPEEKHSDFGSDVVMYVHMGQHTCGSLEWAKEQSNPSVDEILPLLNELIHVVGYNDLEITTVFK